MGSACPLLRLSLDHGQWGTLEGQGDTVGDMLVDAGWIFSERRPTMSNSTAAEQAEQLLYNHHLQELADLSQTRET